MNIAQYLPDNEIAKAIYGSWEKRAKDKPRTHLGASEIGDECERKLWLKFRHCCASKFEGRMLRLFDRGKREEAIVLDDLRAIGCTVWETDDDGNQFKAELFGGHFAGSCDAVTENIPGAEKATHVVEIKTVNAKGFAKLTKEGVRKANPTHWAQMQVYMSFFDLSRALYISVNKDTDEIHVERIHADKAQQALFICRAERTIFSEEPPTRIGRNPADFACKFCDCHDVCWQIAVPPRACRNCCSATPLPANAEWSCDQGNDFGTVCPEHLFVPPIISDKYEMTSDGTVKHDIDGKVYYDARDAEFLQPEGMLIPRDEVIHTDEPGMAG